MINAVSGLPNTPASNSRPSFDQVVSNIQGSSANNTGSSFNKPVNKSRFSPKMILGGVMLILLLLGSGVAYWLSNQEQDLRQQASEGDRTAICGRACDANNPCGADHTCSDNKCVATACVNGGANCDANKCLPAIQTMTTTAAGSCSLTFTAAAAPNPTLSCTKTTYRDEFSNTAGNYTYTTAQTSFEPGDVIVFRIDVTRNSAVTETIALSDVLGSNNLDQVDFMDSTCGASAYNTATRTLSCNITPDASMVRTIGFRVRVKNSVSTNLSMNNTAGISAGSTSVTCQANVTVQANASSTPTATPTNPPGSTATPTPTPTATPIVVVSPNPQCGQSCTGSGQGTCPTGHTCSNGTCALNQCVNGGTCTSDRCSVIQYVTTIVQASPTVGCNQTCVTNADCASNSHICVSTDQGMRCRLESNPGNASCVQEVAYVPAQVPATARPASQPQLPEKLPVAGSADIIKAFIIGFFAVILGIVGLLLL